MSPAWRARHPSREPGGGEVGSGGEEVLPLLPTADKSLLNSGKSLIVKLWGGDRYIKHCFLWLECSEVFSLNSHIMFCKHLGSTCCLHRVYITKDIPNMGGGQPGGSHPMPSRGPREEGQGPWWHPHCQGTPLAPGTQWVAHHLWALPSSPITLRALLGPSPRTCSQ